MNSMRKLDPNFFIKAAELVLKKNENGELGSSPYIGGCLAISLACGNHPANGYRDFFCNVFCVDAAKENNNYVYWMGERNKENSVVRANALLLCAEMCK